MVEGRVRSSHSWIDDILSDATKILEQRLLLAQWSMLMMRQEQNSEDGMAAPQKLRILTMCTHNHIYSI